MANPGGIPHNGKGPAMVRIDWPAIKAAADLAGICPNKLAQFMELQKHPELAGKGFMHWCEWCEARKNEQSAKLREDHVNAARYIDDCCIIDEANWRRFSEYPWTKMGEFWIIQTDPHPDQFDVTQVNSVG